MQYRSMPCSVSVTFTKLLLLLLTYTLLFASIIFPKREQAVDGGRVEIFEEQEILYNMKISLRPLLGSFLLPHEPWPR